MSISLQLIHNILRFSFITIFETTFRTPVYISVHYVESWSMPPLYLTSPHRDYISKHVITNFIENNVRTRVTNCFSDRERVILVFIRQKGSKCQNNTQGSAETVRHDRTLIISFLTPHNESINDDKNDDLYIAVPCLTHAVFVLLMMSQSTADGVTITRQLWRYHVIYLVIHRFLRRYSRPVV